MSLQHEKGVALVTGAGRGIGKAIALRLAGCGYHVVCVSQSAGSCGAAAEEINQNGGSAEALAVDVSDATAVREACESILGKHEVVDVLVNNAGITRDGLLLRMSEDDWDQVMATNLSSCFYWVKGLSRPMTRKRHGRIINISSVVGLMGNAGQVNYAAAKAGMLGFTKSLAREFAGRSVTANVVAPGFIDTDMTSSLTDEVRGKISAQIPLKRLGKADDIAAMVEFLASEEANYITGQVFTVDGGMVM
ncbi:MAG: 3-oxoacyl-[acyl-carrier-protein] reductase [Opitutales bacterium]|nr:3-oxoacyl-[acyl-carrier-protein] reductase [Opitutales bacterium]MCH8539151.1 3-oxoacyl-[acyl-carrier-protein] reductase [Opitutales bacterium]